MYDCEAVIERGNFWPSPAAESGAKAGCPFCLGRVAPTLTPGQRIVILNGVDAGAKGTITRHSDWETTDIMVKMDGDSGGQLRHLSRNWQLVSPISVAIDPPWMPPFSTRHNFVIDELSVWASNYYNQNKRIDLDRIVLQIVYTCWRKRICITSSELEEVLLVHGVPKRFMRKISDRFQFGVKTLEFSVGRRSVRKWRTRPLPT